MKRSQILTAALLLQIASPAFAKISADVTAPATAKPGEEVTVTVKTDPKVHCEIEAQDAGVTQTLNLVPHDADKSGKVTWNFKIPNNYSSDKMPIIVTVSKKGEKATDKCVKEIEIKK